MSQRQTLEDQRRHPALPAAAVALTGVVCSRRFTTYVMCACFYALLLAMYTFAASKREVRALRTAAADANDATWVARPCHQTRRLTACCSQRCYS